MNNKDKDNKCPVCGVYIINGIAHFSYGKPGTKEKLYARVCKYAKQEGCINKNIDISNIKVEDNYIQPKEIKDIEVYKSIAKEINNGLE